MSDPAGGGVLITRPIEDAAATAAQVAACGYRPVIAPFLEVRTRPALMPAKIQAILLTSRNAVPALPPCDLPVLAVGDATAAAARAAGFARVRSAGRDAEALVALACAELDPHAGALLLACGARQALAPAASLRQAGFAVLRRVAYEAVPVTIFPAEAADALRNQILHAALFMSADTAAAFVRCLPQRLETGLKTVIALAIGKRAADTLSHLPWRGVRTACAPTLDDVLALL